MATKKKDTPAGYDRWDTIPGAIKGTGAPLTKRQKEGIAQAKREQAALKKKNAKKKK
ncbi:MAG: hypothetical protein IJI25_08780 [Eubacterium sp.]|nr:hypothetical protein [Eubacterium sp.]